MLLLESLKLLFMLLLESLKTRLNVLNAMVIDKNR